MPLSGIGYHWQYYKKHPFARLSEGNLPETKAKNPPPPHSRENGNTLAASHDFE